MDCRFLDAPDQVGRVRWFEAAPDAETLPFESVILRTDWEIDPWMDAPVGEVSGAARSTDLTRAPRGSGRGHVCGTEEEFREGAHYDPDAPPVLYGGSGLPHCCGLWPVLRGGAGAGGRIGIVVAAAVVPGPDCAGAAVIEFDTWYSATHPGSIFVVHWFKVPGPHDAGDYKIEGVGAIPFNALQLRVIYVCPNTELFDNVPPGGGCVSLSYPSSGFDLYVTMQVNAPSAPIAYSFRVNPGTCS